jgi:hypothetical protein
MVARDLAARDHDLADMEPYSESERLFSCVPDGLPSKFILNGDRECKGSFGGVKHCEDAVSRRVDDLAGVVTDERAEQCDRAGDTVDRALLVGLISRE